MVVHRIIRPGKAKDHKIALARDAILNGKKIAGEDDRLSRIILVRAGQRLPSGEYPAKSGTLRDVDGWGDREFRKPEELGLLCQQVRRKSDALCIRFTATGSLCRLARLRPRNNLEKSEFVKVGLR